MRVKLDSLEVKNVKNEEKILKQEEEIIKLKAKVDAKLDFDHQLEPFSVESNLPSTDSNKIIPTYKKESSSGESPSSKLVIPASCRELSLIGHSLDGLYLVKNINTKKIETVYCDFGDSGKLICKSKSFRLLFKDKKRDSSQLGWVKV